MHALKPVISGYSPETLEECDSAVLLTALGEEVSEKAVEKISPWRFAPPISPDMAARQERRRINLESVVGFCRKVEKRYPGGRHHTLLIEGVGGAMVPLNRHHTVLDWMAALKVPTLLVAGSYLGTISHTLTTISAMRAKGVEPAALVVCESEENPVPVGETVKTLVNFLPDLPVDVIDRVKGGKRPWEQVADLTGLVEPKT